MTPDLSQSFQFAMQLHQAGRRREAEDAYRRVLTLAPNHADALHYMGLLLFQAGRGAEGIELMRRAVNVAPGAPHYWTNLAHALKLTGNVDEAIALWRNVTQRQPGFVSAWAELAGCLQMRGRFSEAAEAARNAVALKPDDAALRVLLGGILLAMEKTEDAEAEFRRAISLRPQGIEGHNNLGAALHAQGKLSEAEAALRQAVAVMPGSAEAHTNLGLSLHMQGRVAEGAEQFRRAVELDPKSADAHDRLLYAMLHDPTATPAQIRDEHARWAARHAEPLLRERSPHRNDPDPTRRLKIGYVSIDFRHHSVAYFLEPLLASHDPAQVEVICYADVPNPDDATARFRRYAHQWRDVHGMTDGEIAQLVRNDGIDILVDLVGHTNQRLLNVFARKPAPVQVTYLGYPATSGLSSIDYRITDAIADPPGMSERWHVEKLVRLPDSAWCYRPLVDAPPVAEAPCVKNGYITFGSFNMLPKITPAVIELWSRILRETPGSRLVVKTRSFSDEPSSRRFAEQFQRAGIAPDRLALRSRTDAQVNHLADYGNIDIELDTFPYNGTTIICESLWMGVPVVSLAGESHVSRVGASLLTTVGLRDLVATTPQEYVRTATTLARDQPALSVLRAEIREKMARSPLRDEARFARAMERIYRMIWQTWCTRNRSDDSKSPTARASGARNA